MLVRRFTCFLLSFGAFLSLAHSAHARGPAPSATPEAAPGTMPPEPAQEPPPSPAPGTSPPPAADRPASSRIVYRPEPDRRLSRVAGDFAIGATSILGAGEPTLPFGQVGVGGFWKNAYFGVRAAAGARDDARLVHAAAVGRLLGSDTDSGPFVGAGLGILHVGVENQGAMVRTNHSNTGIAMDAEVGVIVRGSFLAGLRLSLPMFSLAGTTKSGASLPGGEHAPEPVRVTPLPLSVFVGFVL